MRLSNQHVWAVLMTAATASPLASRDLRFGVLPSETHKDEQLWCGPLENLDNTDNVQEVLDRTGLASAIASQVGDESPAQWLEKLQRLIFKDPNMQGKGVRDCATVESTCSPGKGWGCRETFRNGEDDDEELWFKISFWIFESVHGVHDKMKLIRKELIDETITTGLELSKMAEDFETSLSDEKFKSGGMPEWISTVLGIGQTAAGLGTSLTSVGKALGVISTALDFANGFVEEDEDATVSLSTIQSQLASAFTDSSDGIDRILRAAMGRAWDDQRGDYDKLPQLGGSDFSQPIGSFYYSPFWLLDNDSKAAHDLITAATQSIRQHIIDMIIQGLEYVVLWDATIESEDDCQGNGQKWLHIDGESRCFTMGYKNNINSHSPVDDDTDLWEKMEKWGMPGSEIYYRSSIECARSSCDNVNRNMVESIDDDNLPLCYFSAPVLKYDIVTSGTSCSDAQTAACSMPKPETEDFWAEDKKKDCPN